MPYIKTAWGRVSESGYSWLFHHMFVAELFSVNVLPDFPFELGNQISEKSQGVRDGFLSSEL